MLAIAVVSAIIAICARLDSSISAKASELSARAAEHSNHIAEKQLDTYRDDIAYLRQKCISIHCDLEVFFPKAHSNPFSSGKSPFEQGPQIQDKPNGRPSGIVAVANLRNMGVRIELRRIDLLIMRPPEIQFIFIPTLFEPIHIDRGGTAKVYFSIDPNAVDALVSKPTPTVRFEFETTPIQGESECKPFELQPLDASKLASGLNLWKDSLHDAEPLHMYNTRLHAKVNIWDYMRNTIHGRNT